MTIALASVVTDAPSDATQWTFDPWRERPRVAAFATVALLALCGLLTVAREPLLVSLTLALACAAAFAPALAPSECVLDAQGARLRGPLGWQQRSWARVRRIERLRGGLLLSPYARRHWLDTARGVVLPASAARLEALLHEAERLRAIHAA